MPDHEFAAHVRGKERNITCEASAMDCTGYRQAVIHLAWVRDAAAKHLLFGMVELRPSELPDAVGCAAKSILADPKRHMYLHYRRFVLTAAEAIDWYEHAVGGNLAFPLESGQPARKYDAKLEGGPFVQEPPWPHFVTSNELVFAPDWMHGSRTHFLFPKHAFRGRLAETIRVHANLEKLEEWLHFDLGETYSDYQGVLCLVAPNPVFRSVERTQVEETTASPPESVAYKVIARHGQRLDGVRLEIVNERVRGRMVPLVHEFGSDAITVLKFPAEVRKEGESITHPAHGLLSWHEPLPILRTIHTRMELTRRRKMVQVPAARGSRPAYEYEVNKESF